MPTYDHRIYIAANRVYRNFRHDSGTIAQEVLTNGKSEGWMHYDDKDLKIAKEIENQLAEFNIGCTDDMRGTWSYVKGGSNNF